jgi:phosphate starvation-inducible protein PhoH
MTVSRARSSRPANRRERRLAKQQGENGNVTKLSTSSKQHLTLKDIKPLTDNQERIFSDYTYNDLLVTGYAGTGKSLCLLYLALNDIINEKLFKRVVIIRSAVNTRNIGFLPGGEKEKTAVYEAPYKSICSYLFGRGDAYELLKKNGIIEFTTTSFLRGETIDDAVVLLEEVQNFSDSEVNTAITRLGENSKLLINGDFRQNDLYNKRNEESCIKQLLNIAKYMDNLSIIEMEIDDIVRSSRVKSWIIARSKLGLM